MESTENDGGNPLNNYNFCRIFFFGKFSKFSKFQNSKSESCCKIVTILPVLDENGILGISNFLKQKIIMFWLKTSILNRH